MTPTGRRWGSVTPDGRRGPAWLIAIMLQMAGHATAPGQVPPAGLATPEELPAPSIVSAPGEARRRLERLRWLVDNQHWNDAAELANELLTKATDGWVAIDRERYVGFREAVHRAVAAGGPEALAAYRSLVDPLAEAWLLEGEKKLDAGLLWRIVDEAYASSAGDDALWSLGELALERGDFQLARWAWQQIRPETMPAGCLGYPDSPIALAAVRARLALVSIRAGDRARARREVRQLTTEHAAATGRLGGREVNYAKRLGELMEQAEDWPPVEAGHAAWSTLGGTPQRTNVAPISVTTGGEFQQIWSVTVEAPATPIVEPTTLAELAPRARRPIFPVVARGVVLFQDAQGVHAYDLETGKPAGGEGGLIFAAPKLQELRTRSGVVSKTNAVSPTYALTVSDGRLLAVASQLVCLDLNREGALVFGREPAAEDAAFSAPPLGNGSRAAVVELHRGVGMSAAIVGFDFWRREPLWRCGLASVEGSEPVANTPVLSADAGFVYVSSNLGFIAALRADNGAPLWLRTYSRKPVNDGAAYARALDPRPNPCIVHGSLVLATPRDTGEILALDAASGALVWSQPLPAADAQLLAVDKDEAFLSGDRLWKLEVETGKIDPHGGEELRGGAGQGVLADDAMFWPTQHEILLVDRRTGRPAGSPIDLPGGGANLAVAAGAGGEGQYIVAAGPTHVTVFRQTPTNATTRDE